MKIQVPVSQMIADLENVRAIGKAALREAGTKVGVEASEYLKKGLSQDGGRGRKMIHSRQGEIFPLSHSHRLQRSMGWKITRNTTRQFFFMIGSVIGRVNYFKYLADPKYKSYRSFMDSAGLRKVLQNFHKHFTEAFNRMKAEKLK